MTRPQLESILNIRIRSILPLTGGDVSKASLVETVDGSHLVVKQNDTAPVGMFELEADGLRRLGESGAIRVPNVLAVRDGEQIPPEDRLIAMEYIVGDSHGGSSHEFGKRFGRALAGMHSRLPSPNGCYGLERDNFLGRRSQANPWTTDFSAFYRDQRITPVFESARHKLDPHLANRVASLRDRIPDLLKGMLHRACLIHGDLWSGNYIATGGEPVLIDPAAYYGHPEIEWAYIELFEGFPKGLRDGYDEVGKLDSGYEERRPLLQLYHVLVHVEHFGEPYPDIVEQICRAYGA